MTIDQLKKDKLLLFESISGSVAYGTNLPGSDIDKRGVFVLPKKDFYGLNRISQVNDETNDQVYYELEKFMELLSKSNPNMLEMLAMPPDCIQVEHPLFKKIDPKIFLSKQCEQTFAGYAFTQIRKAKGLNKKIVNPVPKERKTILHFCHIIKGHGSIPLVSWLEEKGIDQKNCGLSKIPHFRDVYALFYDSNNEFSFKGVMNKTISNDVCLSSIPKGLESIASLSFNKDGYQVYCKNYKEYWDWVEKRNEERYKNTLSHGKNYDAKNMMHTFRLLDMAEDIALGKGIIVRRPNREFLLKIRHGDFEYDELVKRAEKKLITVKKLFKKSELPSVPNVKHINNLLVNIRDEWYVNS